MPGFRVVAFEPRHATAFRELNLAWIERHFEIEAVDREVLLHPEETILASGGAILVAEGPDGVLGVCALRCDSPGRYEVTKMAVREDARGQGIGRHLLSRVISHARELGARQLFIISNTVLEPAIHLYRQLGFDEVPLPPDQDYARGNIALELSLAQASPMDAGHASHERPPFRARFQTTGSARAKIAFGALLLLAALHVTGLVPGLAAGAVLLASFLALGLALIEVRVEIAPEELRVQRGVGLVTGGAMVAPNAGIRSIKQLLSPDQRLLVIAGEFDSIRVDLSRLDAERLMAELEARYGDLVSTEHATARFR